jgi:HEAT repeat protein
VKKLIPIACIALALTLAGCSLFQRSEAARVQKQRDAANKFAGGNWMERRDAVREIITYLGKDKNDLIIGTLMAAAADSYDAVRIEGVKGLAKIKTEGACATLKKIAVDDSEKNSNVRWYAIRALRGFKDSSIGDIYVKGLSSDDWLIREASARGIVSIDDAALSAALVPHIVRAINDPNSSVSLAALRGVKVKDPRLYTAIVDRLNGCSEYDISRMEACLASLDGYRLDQKTKEKVINLLIHNDMTVRILALRVLKKDKVLTTIDAGKIKP